MWGFREYKGISSFISVFKCFPSVADFFWSPDLRDLNCLLCLLSSPVTDFFHISILSWRQRVTELWRVLASVLTTRTTSLCLSIILVRKVPISRLEPRESESLGGGSHIMSNANQCQHFLFSQRRVRQVNHWLFSVLITFSLISIKTQSDSL